MMRTRFAPTDTKDLFGKTSNGRMTLSLYQSDSDSVLYIKTDKKTINIHYDKNIHKLQSESDFSTIKTELLTYGDEAAMQVVEYYIQPYQLANRKE